VERIKGALHADSMMQMDIMEKADMTYKDLVARGVLQKTERQVASCMEMSAMYFHELDSPSRVSEFY
jgi:hypothetical protein